MAETFRFSSLAALGVISSPKVQRVPLVAVGFPSPSTATCYPAALLALRMGSVGGKAAVCPALLPAPSLASAVPILSLGKAVRCSQPARKQDRSWCRR